MAQKRHPSARRTPPGPDEPDDAFIAKTLELYAWARNNTQFLVALSLLLVLTVGGGLYYWNYRTTLHTQAANELEQVQQRVGFADPETAKEELRGYLQRFGGTPFAAEARILLAQVHLEEEDPEEAIAVLDPATASLSDPVNLHAGFLLARSYEQADRTEDAMDLYLRLGDEAEFRFQSREALGNAARIRTEREEYEEAAAIYRRILATYDEEAPEMGVYQMRLAEVNQMMR